MKKDSQVYREYVKAMSPGGGGATILAKRLKMRRDQLYRIVRRVRDGNPAQAKICMKKGSLECLWMWMFQSRYEALPRDRKPATVKELRDIIHSMQREGFPVKQIARLLGKDRSTVLHHLGK